MNSIVRIYQQLEILRSIPYLSILMSVRNRAKLNVDSPRAMCLRAFQYNSLEKEMLNVQASRRASTKKLFDQVIYCYRFYEGVAKTISVFTITNALIVG